MTHHRLPAWIGLTFYTIVFSCFQFLAIPLAQAQIGGGQDPPVIDGMMLWLDATDTDSLFQEATLTVPADFGDPIGAWLDKSGNEFHATQSGIARPEYVADAMNGLPAVRLHAGDADGLAINDDLALERPYSVFIVNQYWGDSRGRTLQSQDTNWLHGLWSGNPSSFAVSGFVSINQIAEQEFVYVADTTGTQEGDSTFFVNGIDRTVNSSPAGSPGRLGIGSAGQFPLEVSDADISEILIYDRVLSETELESTREYLYSKYSATLLNAGPPPAPFNTVLSGEVGTFTGDDPGEGLDLEGVFLYALDVGGPGGQRIGDIDAFTDASIAGIESELSPGVTMTVANEITDWLVADFGEDVELASVMQSIRWATPGDGGFEIELEVPDAEYQLQLMFGEACCDRGFDILLEDELAVDNFSISRLQADPTEGAYFRDTVTVTDGKLNVTLGGSNPRLGDNNPILNALTLEIVGQASADCDFNGDSACDVADIDLLMTAVASGENETTYDLSGDGVVDDADRDSWLASAAEENGLSEPYFVGDSNLDLQVNAADLNAVGNSWQSDNTTWSQGNYTGDGVGVADLNAMALNWQKSHPDAPAAAAVPEPSGLSLLVVLSLLLSPALRRRN